MSTDESGRFSIKAQKGDVLLFSMVGYTTYSYTVGSNEPINVVLNRNSQKLDDVVVIGYGKQKSSEVVSAISQIKGEELQLPGRNLTNNLAGQVAGLIAVQRSGEPGYDNSEIYIRGISSFAGGTGALILVDGVPRSMQDISPEEIETFTVLKDASATAIYGAEGANGVILITSKRGKNQRTMIDFRADYMINQPTRKMSFLGSKDFLNLYNEAKWNSEGNPNQSSFIPYKTQEQIEKYASGEDPDLYPDVNWMDLFKNSTPSQRLSLNFRGGAEKLRFFVGTNYYNEAGLFKSNPIDATEYDREAKYSTNIGLKRYNLRSNVDMTVSKNTTLKVDISGQYLTTNYPGTGTGTIYNNMLNSAPYLTPMIYSNGLPARYSASAGYENPYTQLNLMGYSKEYRVAMQSGVTLEQNLNNWVKGLTARGLVSFDSDFFSKTSRTRTPSQYVAKGRDDNGDIIFSKTVNGLATSTEAAGGGFSGGNKKIYMEASLNYSRVFGQHHSVTGLLLYNQKESQLQNDPYLYRKQSAVGRASYALKGRYFVDVSVGFTGSENFSRENRYGFFPAVGLGYTITQEEWFKPFSSSIGLDRLKIRASVGRAGNDKVSDTRFPYRERLTWSTEKVNLGMSSSGGINASGNLLYEGQAYNPNIGWEIEEKRNIGLDITFLKSINLTVDYFNNLRHDILLRRNSVSGAAGFQQNPYQNYGKVSNKGLDASFDATHAFGNAKIGLRGTFTLAKNRILEMDEVPREMAYQNLTGTRIGQVDAWIAERLYTEDDFDITTNPTTGASSYSLKTSLPQLGVGFGAVRPGNIKYKDLNGDGVIDNNDWTRDVPGVETTVPQIIYGFGLNFEYKGFYLSPFFQGAAAASTYMSPTVMLPFAESDPQTTSAKAFAQDRWTVDNPNQNALLPRLELTPNSNDNRRSSWWLRDASFLRLKNVEIGYNISEKALSRANIKGLRIYILGQNLAVWDHIKFWDPEQSDNVGNYPIQRTYNIGMNLTF
ncbi:SusC/RagA family TonB-linked outer membrane protein [Sphingobacterium siyangense]|uniref:SusC/RagA family TonB-linked outer membrane protein n=1 Tax=Sphingobacterium siyangense TaxID=459529 RepID=UPI003DA52E0D